MSPDFCALTVVCKDVSGPSDYLTCEDLDSNNQLSKSFDSADYQGGLKPGVYTYTFQVTTNYDTDTSTAQADVTKEFSFNFELIEPCTTPPATIQRPILVN